jgi:hypothetical protein
LIKSVLLNCSKLLIAFALGLIVCGNGRAETRSVSSKNKACFGDTTDVLLVGDSIRNELKLKVPTKYFGDLPIYRGAEQISYLATS